MDKKSRKQAYAHDAAPTEFEMSEVQDKAIQAIIEASEKELDDCRVNFRWQKEPLSVVRKAAAAAGVPYQTYMKQVVFKQATADLAQIAVAAGAPQVSTDLKNMAEKL